MGPHGPHDQTCDCKPYTAQVGQGCAVLCGTHPELTPEHLSPACCFDNPPVPEPDPTSATLSSRHPPLATTPRLVPQADSATSGQLRHDSAMDGSPTASGKNGVESGQGRGREGGGLQGGRGGKEGVEGEVVKCGDISLVAHARGVHRRLQACQPARQMFWETLLTAAGLPIGVLNSSQACGELST